MLVLLPNRSMLTRSPLGGIAIGVLSIVVAVLFLVMLGCNYEVFQQTRGEATSINAMKIRTAITMGLAFYLNFNITSIIAGVLLIIGMKKRNHLMLLPWMVNYCFWFFLTFMYLLAPTDLRKVIVVLSAISLHYILFGTVYVLFKKFQFDEEIKKKQQQLQTTLANLEQQQLETKPNEVTNYEYQKF